jgi:polyisoprenoid-binding protein YceI
MAGRWSGKRIVVVAVVAVVVVLGGAYGLFALVSGGGEEPVSIGDVDVIVGDTGADGTSAAAFDGDFEGVWSLVPDASFVGYRVREQLVFLPAPNDAVGRTSAVEGSLEIVGTDVVAATVTADLTQLESDEARRDDAIRMNGLESASFPTATFELTEPIAFGETPPEGEVVEVDATGELTLHGVTRTVTLPLEARWDGGQISVVGSLEIAFADFDITPPSLGPATVEDHGTMELQLVFVPGA